MGIILRHTSYSPNIKERRDFSCGLFDQQARLIASKDGIPVHLGSMDLSVQSGLENFRENLVKGDILIHNSPFLGGTHLPDITMYAPVFDSETTAFTGPVFYVGTRAHHSDVGGRVPGSMPGHSDSIFDEGIIIPPVKLWEGGELNTSTLELILANVRTPKERKGDLRAQRAALETGIRRLHELFASFPPMVLNEYLGELAHRAEVAMAKQLELFPLGKTFTAEDYLEGIVNGSDAVIKTTVIRKSHDKVTVDFSGSSPMIRENANATKAITRSCVFYVFRYLLSGLGEVPTNYGLWRPIELILPEGSIVNARFPYATSSGNVETSQRIVDVLFLAISPLREFLVPAASQGTMNNILIGSEDSLPFSYYETIGGGSGGSESGAGISGIHTHMTNTWNTPVEAVETSYPLRIHTYQFRDNSGGRGKHSGGDGIIREYEILCDTAIVSLQTERRKHAPYGLFGGGPGATGKNELITAAGTNILAGRTTLHCKLGDRIRIQTPGGGGYGLYEPADDESSSKS